MFVSLPPCSPSKLVSAHPGRKHKMSAPFGCRDLRLMAPARHSTRPKGYLSPVAIRPFMCDSMESIWNHNPLSKFLIGCYQRLACFVEQKTRSQSLPEMDDDIVFPRSSWQKISRNAI